MIGPAVLLIEETLQESILRPQKLSLLLLKFAPITCIYYILLHIETLLEVLVSEGLKMEASGAVDPVHSK